MPRLKDYNIEMRRKKAILKMLKEYGRSSTTRISFVALGHTNAWIAERYLEMLEKEGKVVHEVETNATYWKIKGEK